MSLTSLAVKGIRSSNGHGHNFLTDNSTETCWVHNGTTAFVELELAVPTIVSSVMIGWGEGDRLRYEFNIEVSEDQMNWHRVFGPMPSTKKEETYSLTTSASDIKTKFVKVNVFGNNSPDINEKTRTSISEVQLFAGQTLKAAAAGQKLTARMTVSAKAPTDSEIIADGTRSAGNITSYEYSSSNVASFDKVTPDGAIVKFKTPNKDGKIKLTLTVKDAKGKTDSDTDTIDVTGGGPPPPPTCPAGQHWDAAAGACVPDIPPTPGAVIYDSNIHGKWNNGQSRIVVKSEGSIAPNGKGLFTAASGDPEVHIDGKGVAMLVTKPGFGRFYLCVCNFNAQLDFDFNIASKNVDNMSIKGRSRHQAGGAPENRFGGLGNATSLVDTDFKIELYHNVHEQGYTQKLNPKLELGKWYHKRYIYHNTADNKGIKMEDWIDYNDGRGLIKVFERTETKPKPYAMDKKMFDKESWIWFRLNGSGSIGFKNVKVTEI